MLVHLNLADEVAALGLEAVAPHGLEAGVALGVGGDSQRRQIDIGDDDVRRLACFEPKTPDRQRVGERGGGDIDVDRAAKGPAECRLVLPVARAIGREGNWARPCR